MIPRRIDSPNRTRGCHWRTRHRETMTWELEIVAAAAGWQAWSLIVATETRRDRAGRWRLKEIRRQERRRVSIVRQVPRVQDFIRDADNRAFCTKGLIDALKRLGLVYDDASSWMVREFEERVGEIATFVRIEREPTTR